MRQGPRCGHYLGKEDTGNASRLFSQSILAVFLAVAILSLLAFIFLDQVVLFLGANEALAPQLREYLKVILLFNLFLPSGFALNYFVSLDNNPLLASASMFGSAGINILMHRNFKALISQLYY